MYFFLASLSCRFSHFLLRLISSPSISLIVFSPSLPSLFLSPLHFSSPLSFLPSPLLSIPAPLFSLLSIFSSLPFFLSVLIFYIPPFYRTSPNTEWLWWQLHYQDVPLSVCQLLCLFVLHRILQRKVSSSSEACQLSFTPCVRHTYLCVICSSSASCSLIYTPINAHMLLCRV